jgi:hypothetical protein
LKICFIFAAHDLIQERGFAFGEFNCLVHVTILAHARPRASLTCIYFCSFSVMEITVPSLPFFFFSFHLTRLG